MLAMKGLFVVGGMDAGCYHLVQGRVGLESRV